MSTSREDRVSLVDFGLQQFLRDGTSGEVINVFGPNETLKGGPFTFLHADGMFFLRGAGADEDPDSKLWKQSQLWKQLHIMGAITRL